MDDEIEIVDDDFKPIVITEKHVPESCKSPKPGIAVTPLARWKMHALAKIVCIEHGSYETIAYVIGTEVGRADDIIVPVHEISSAYVEIKPEHIQSIFPEIEAKNKKREEFNKSIREKNDAIDKENAERMIKGQEPLPRVETPELKPLRVTGWTHSHARMNVFSSGTDDAQHKRLHDELVLGTLPDTIVYGNGDDSSIPKPFYVFGITVNVREEEYGVIYVSFPCGFQKQVGNVEIVETGDVLSPDEKMNAIREIYDNVKEKVKFFRHETNTRAGWKGWHPWGDNKPFKTGTTAARETTFASMQRPKVNPSIVTTTLDAFFNKNAVTIQDFLTDVKKQSEWRNVAKDAEILGEWGKIKAKLCDENKPLYDFIKERFVAVMARERDILLKIMEGSVQSLSEKRIHEKERDEVRCAFCDAVLDDDPDLEPPNKNVNGDPVCERCFETRCYACGTELHDEHEYDKDDNMVCTECFNATCYECGMDISDERTENPDGYPVCPECHAKYENEDEQDEDEETDDYYDDDGNQIKCWKCSKKLVKNANSFGYLDDDGNELCIDCVKIDASLTEPGTVPVPEDEQD